MASSSRSGRRTSRPRAEETKISPQRQLRFRLASATVLLLTLVVSVYSNSLQNGFVWDDHEQLVMNPAVQPGAPLSPLFSSDVRFSHLGLSAQTHTYRPLQMATYLVIANLFGTGPGAFHGCSVLFAMAGVLAAFFVFQMLTERVSLAIVASVLFAVNPLHSEAVDWAAAIPDLGCGLCLLIAFGSFLILQRNRDPSARRRWSGWPLSLLSLAAFAAALLWKETALVFPVLIGSYSLILESAWRRRVVSALKESAPYWVICGVYLVARVQVLGSLATGGRSWKLTPIQFALTDSHLFALYWLKLLVPFPLNAYYQFRPLRSILDPRAIAGILFVVCVICGLVYLIRHAVLAGFAALWVCLTLLPVLDINALGRNAFTERYLYIPSVGFCLLITLGSTSLIQRLGSRYRKPVGAVLIVVTASTLAAETIHRNPVWKDDETLFSQTLTNSPDAAFVRNMVASAESNDPSKWSSAGQNYSQAVTLAWEEIPPDQLALVTAYNGLALVYLQREEFERALHALNEAQRIAPGNFETNNVQGLVLLRAGRWQEAEPLLEKALTVEPRNENVLSELGLLEWQHVHDLTKAAGLFHRALAIHIQEDDFSASLYSNLGGVDADRVNFSAAIEEFGTAARIAPHDPEYHTNLANALAAVGRYAEARQEAELALQLAPGFPPAEATLDHLNHLSR
jgi:Flp pilus assembly protein TadD